jgi:glycosyltransferase involved in cell wall biosynthesis
MKVLVYPKAKHNPYHSLLYGELERAHSADRFSYVTVSARTVVLFPLIMLARRLQGYRVFHLHWHAFYLSPKYGLPFTKTISLLNTVWSLTVLKLLGYKLIWTVHNVLPHEPETSNDRFVARYTARLASRLIIHSKQAEAELAALGIDTRKATVIPHGNYDGLYGKTPTRETARKQLNIKPHETVMLFFGNIRPYKGVEDELLPAFVRLHDKNTRLIIAGRCQDAALAKTISRFAKQHATITFYNGAVPEALVPLYFRAADVACMPFKAITTSGSVILATTFGKPIVAPRLGALKDIPREAGVLYDPAKKDALLHALQKVTSDAGARSAMSQASRAYADTLAWDKLAAKTYAVYRAN